MCIRDRFKEFIARGNVIDLAVGVIIGGAFGKIVTSLVNDIIMPPIGYMMHGINFADLYVSLSGNTTVAGKKLSYDAAKTAGDAVIGYGAFLNTLLEFFIVAVCVFCLLYTSRCV